MINQIKRDIIAGHEKAIEVYIDVIADLMPLQRILLVDRLINQYLAEIKVLREELQEMKNAN